MFSNVAHHAHASSQCAEDCFEVVAALWATIDATMFILFKFVLQSKERDLLCDTLLRIFNGG